MLRQSARFHTADAPIASKLWAAGFSFSTANVLREVPYDPNLKHLFFGEEAGE